LLEFLKTVLKTRDFNINPEHREEWIFRSKGVTSTDLLQSSLLLIGEVSSCRCGKLGVPKYLYLVRIIPVMPQ